MTLYFYRVVDDLRTAERRDFRFNRAAGNFVIWLRAVNGNRWHNSYSFSEDVTNAYEEPLTPTTIWWWRVVRWQRSIGSAASV
jgi:hypothetical protein